MRFLRVVLGVVLTVGMLLAGGVLPHEALAAAEIVVADNTDYPCTRDGLASAIADVDQDGAVRFNCADETIEFDSQIVIKQRVLVDGSNSGSEQIVLDGVEDDGIDTNFLRVDAGSHLTLSHMTLQHGSRPSSAAQNLGGAINVHAGGILDVSAATFIENEADWGGAINGWQNTQISISQSTFVRNHAVQGGGALYSLATMKVGQSSFVDNTSERDGGAIVVDGTLDIVASTFSGNSAASAGSTLRLSPGNESASINWTTIWQPDGTGAAIHAENPLNVTGVIFAGFGTHCDLRLDGDVIDEYTISNDTSCGLGGFGSGEGFSVLGIGPLQTATIDGVAQSYHPLLDGSPAINNGPSNCDTDLIDGDDPDQLGQSRPNEFLCDIGAFESDQPPIIEASSPGGNEGQVVPLNVNVTQASNESTAQVDCMSDGTWTDVEGGCIYPDNGTFDATFLIKDGYEVGIAVVSVLIANVNPEITKFESSTLTAITGDLVTFTTLAEDVPADEPLTYIYDCEGGQQAGDSACRFSRGGLQQITVTVSDGDGGEATQTLTIQVYDAVTFCVSNWGGQLRVADGDCGRGEQTVALPQQNFEPLALCVNNWNAVARFSNHCGRSEHVAYVTGDDSVPVCVNTWNGTLRVSAQCTRSEYEDWL